MRSKYSNVKAVFDNLRKNSYNKAQREMTAGLPYAAQLLRDYAEWAMANAHLGDMTGNTINSFGIGLYRDGKFVACATTNSVEGRDPIHVTLKEGDRFERGEMRYDNSAQKYTFVATQGERNFMANERVVNYLRRYAPTRKKGLAYRCVSFLEYNKEVGKQTMMQFADYVESHGGDIREARFT